MNGYAESGHDYVKMRDRRRIFVEMEYWDDVRMSIMSLCSCLGVFVHHCAALSSSFKNFYSS